MIHWRPERMRYVTIFLVKEDVPAVSMSLASFGWFDPVDPVEEKERLQVQTDSGLYEIYTRARKRYDKIVHFIGKTFPVDEKGSTTVPSHDELKDIDRRLGVLWQRCSRCEERQRQLREELKHVRHLQDTLQHYRMLNVNLGRLQKPHSFLDVRIGTVPLSDVDKLADAISLNDYTLTVFETRDNVAHVVIAGDKSKSGDIEHVISAASFRTTRLPDEFHDYPDRLEAQLLEQVKEIEAHEESLETEIRLAAEENADFLKEVRNKLNLAFAHAELVIRLGGRGALGSVHGWVPLKRLDELRQILAEQLNDCYVLESRPPSISERRTVPSYTAHSGLLAPFVRLVGNYGVPRYGELDPVWLFSISYILMFGMMFGDVGHGLMIALAGVVLRNKIPDYWQFLILTGLSSLLFGFVYGSVFGFEEIVHAIWMSPLSDPVLMLNVALVWGVVFIGLMTFLSMRNDWVDGQHARALMSGHGMAGLILYAALLYGGWQLYMHEAISMDVVVIAVIALFSIILYGWRSLESAPGERVLVVLIEAFEDAIGYISNTLSFLRVAAFSLNHVALIVAVFAVANMFGTTGQWITILLGNLFVLILEGAIVAIQVLRLEYYEGFSRFYRGDGVPFRPLKFGDA